MNEFRLDDEIRFPKAALHALVDAAGRSGEPAVAAVREAGRAAGEDLARRLAAVLPLDDVDTTDFWSAVNSETGARGLGTYEWESSLGGHAEVVVHDAPDAAGGGGQVERRPAPFTEGLLEGLLGTTAGEPVAAVCAPADGSSAPRFLVGSPTALRHVRARLARGADLERALEGI